MSLYCCRYSLCCFNGMAFWWQAESFFLQLYQMLFTIPDLLRNNFATPLVRWWAILYSNWVSNQIQTLKKSFGNGPFHHHCMPWISSKIFSPFQKKIKILEKFFKRELKNFFFTQKHALHSRCIFWCARQAGRKRICRVAFQVENALITHPFEIHRMSRRTIPVHLTWNKKAVYRKATLLLTFVIIHRWNHFPHFS